MKLLPNTFLTFLAGAFIMVGVRCSNLIVACKDNRQPHEIIPSHTSFSMSMKTVTIDKC